MRERRPNPLEWALAAAAGTIVVLALFHLDPEFARVLSWWQATGAVLAIGGTAGALAYFLGSDV